MKAYSQSHFGSKFASKSSTLSFQMTSIQGKFIASLKSGLNSILQTKPRHLAALALHPHPQSYSSNLH